MKFVTRILAAVVLLLAGPFLWVVLVHGSGLTLHPNDQITRADFLAIILSALGVMLMAITIFLGALAVIGWATFETRVKQASEAFLEKRFSEDDSRYATLVNDLKEDVTRRILKGGRPEYPNENASPFDEDAA
jgi:hypothetical protein